MSITSIKSLLRVYFPDGRGVDEQQLVKRGFNDFCSSAITNGFLTKGSDGKLYITQFGKNYRDN